MSNNEEDAEPNHHNDENYSFKILLNAPILISLVIIIVSGVLLVYCCLKQIIIICESRISEEQIARATALIRERKELRKLQQHFENEMHHVADATENLYLPVHVEMQYRFNIAIIKSMEELVIPEKEN